jgi:hypothetical protein
MRCGRLRLPHEPTRPQRLFRCSIFSCVVSGAPTAFTRVTSASAGQSGSTSRAVGSSARSDLSAHFCLTPFRGLAALSLGGNGSTARFQAGPGPTIMMHPDRSSLRVFRLCHTMGWMRPSNTRFNSGSAMPKTVQSKNARLGTNPGPVDQCSASNRYDQSHRPMGEAE